MSAIITTIVGVFENRSDAALRGEGHDGFGAADEQMLTVLSTLIAGALRERALLDEAQAAQQAYRTSEQSRSNAAWSSPSGLA